jgi:hypothetical protein
MKSFYFSVILTSLLVLTTVADNPKGISPRPNPSDYAQYSDKKQFVLGASSLPKKAILQSFSTDLTKNYIVVEIGLYPQSGAQIEANRRSFILKEASGVGVIRPLDPQSLSKVRKKTEGGGKDVVFYPTVNVGYESGGHYDPYSGRSYPGGWTTGVGVGVGIENSGNGSSPDDRRVMQTELDEKEFPEGVHTQAACGYLYFPVLEKNKKKSYLLEGTIGGEKFSLIVKADKEQ